MAQTSFSSLPVGKQRQLYHAYMERVCCVWWSVTTEESFLDESKRSALEDALQDPEKDNRYSLKRLEMFRDNLSSDINFNVLELCIKIDVWFVALPPNSTHMMQQQGSTARWWEHCQAEVTEGVCNTSKVFLWTFCGESKKMNKFCYSNLVWD